MLSSFPNTTCSNVKSCFIYSVCSSAANSSSVNSVNFGSISLQNLDKTFAVTSLISLCLIDRKAFLQLIQCCILNLLPQGHVVGKSPILHPYHKQIASQKCCFYSTKPKSLIGSAVSQFDTLSSLLISRNLLDFSDKLFLDWFKLTGIDLPVLFW